MEKLVRDKIPEIIEKKWEKCEFYISDTKNHINFLIEKLLEESIEVKDAKWDSQMKSEIWDLLDVIDKLCELKWFNLTEIDELRKIKTEKRWWFDKWIILTKY